MAGLYSSLHVCSWRWFSQYIVMTELYSCQHVCSWRWFIAEYLFGIRITQMTFDQMFECIDHVVVYGLTGIVDYCGVSMGITAE